MRKCALAIVFIFALSSVAFASPLTDYSKGKMAFDYMYRSSADLDSKLQLGSETSPSKTFDADVNEWGITLGLGNNWAFQYRGSNAKATLLNKSGEVDLPRIPIGAGVVVGESDGYPVLCDDASIVFTPDSLRGAIHVNGKVEAQEYNIMYKLNKSVSAFTGLVRVNASTPFSGKVGITGTPGYPQYAAFSENNDSISLDGGLSSSIRSADKNIWQFGLVGSTEIAKKTNLYGVVGVGSDYTNWEAGLGYQIAKDVEFNVNYRDTKYDKLKLASVNWNYQRGDNAPVAGSADINAKDVEIKGWGFGVTYKF